MTTIGNPFTKPERRAQFDASVKALCELFPNAKPSFIRGQARTVARRVKVATKAPRLKPDRKVRVAVTYRAPTRAERQADHAERMAGRRRYPDSPRGYRVLANLSRNHPDYGCSPAEHARRKAERLPL